MGKLVVTEFVSLDGVMEDPGGAEGFEHGGWTFQFDRGPEGDKFKLDELMASDAQLLGRRTYEGFAQAWPSIKDESGFADKMNAMPKFVVSSTLENADWNNTTVLSGNVPDEVSRLKQQFDGDILVAGSAQLAQSLLQHDLVDELRLMVFPVVLGSGKRLFADRAEMSAFTLVEARQTGSVAILTLRRA
ncbi:MAG TPA: dihydrofolate reductase family protein [Gaiellaceae bacterium]